MSACWTSAAELLQHQSHDCMVQKDGLKKPARAALRGRACRTACPKHQLANERPWCIMMARFKLSQALQHEQGSLLLTVPEEAPGSGKHVCHSTALASHH